MLIDSLNVFDPSATAITSTADSTNILDMAMTGVPADPLGSDLGVGLDMIVRICCQTTFTAAGAATLTIALKAAPDSSGSPGTYIILAQTDAIPKASLVAGAIIDIKIPVLPPQGETGGLYEPAAKVPRFYKLTYTVATGPFTAGTVESFICTANADRPQLVYSANYTVV